MDAQFNVSDFAKDIGRLEAAGEQMLKVGEKVDEVLQRVTKVETRLDENEKLLSRKMFWWGVAITSIITIAIFIVGAAITLTVGTK